MRNKTAVVGLIAIGIALALFLRLRGGESPAPLDGLAQPPEAPEARARGAAADSAAPAELPVAPAARAITAPEPSPPRAPLPGETPATPMAQAIADQRNNMIIRNARVPRDEEGSPVPQGLAEGERQFAAEPIDSEWAPGAESDLLAKFAQMPGLKLIDLQVECRSTMCRLQLTQPRAAPGGKASPAQFNILRDSVGLEPRWVIGTIDSAGSMKSIAYLWRPGFSEPGR